MKYNFDEIVDRTHEAGSYSSKWSDNERMKAMFMADELPEDRLCFFLADMDFRCSPAIIEAVKDCEKVVFAAGTGKIKNKVFQKRQEQVMTALRPYEDKLHCLCNETGGGRLQHPLSPVVREWHLSPLRISELIGPAKEETKQEKKTKGKTAKKNPQSK